MFSSGRRLRTDGSADEDTVLPIESFVDQRDAVRTAPTEQDRINWNTFRILPSRIDDRTLRSRSAKSLNKKNDIIHIIIQMIK